jgi:hypothetical protein
MLSANWFTYEVSARVSYSMGIEFSVRNGKPHVIGAELYKLTGEYVGYWMREEMPLKLIHELQRWLHGDPRWAQSLIMSKNARKGIK